MSTGFEIRVYATSVRVYPGREAVEPLSPLINLLTYEDEFQEMTKTLGYILDEEQDLLYFHKGVDISYIHRLLGNAKVVHMPADDARHMQFEYEEIVPPRNNEQVDCINFIMGINQHKGNENDRQIFLVKNPGFGKGHPLDTKLPSPDSSCGYITIGDLKVGDHVFDAAGQPTEVLEIFDLGETDVFKVTFNDGRISYCTGEHLWQVRTSKYYNWQVKKLCDMIGDFKHLSMWKLADGRLDPYDYKYYIPNAFEANYPDKELPIDPWVMGCFLGDGKLQCEYLTMETCDELANKIGLLYNYEVRWHQGAHNYEATFYDETGSPVKTKEFFKDIREVLDMKDETKYIPSIYCMNSVDNRLRLLQGLMDSDGSISSNKDKRYHVTFTSTSEVLLFQIRWLLYSFGYAGTIVDDGRPEMYNNGYCGILVFRVPNHFKRDLFTLSTKKKVAIKAYSQPQRDHFHGILIKDISYSHRAHCKCIKVDNPDHLYLTEDFIVTHNTFCSGVAACRYGVKTLIIMHRDSLRKQWLHSLYKMCGLSEDEVHEIQDSQEVFDIVHDNHEFDYDIYLMTHATFRAGLKRVGNLKEMSNLTKNLGIGLKIIDEAHLEFRDTLLMDFVFNVQRNLYLTATDGRSTKAENSIFKHVFANTTFYRPSTLLTSNQPSKWVEYNMVQLNTHAKQNIVRYRVEGGRGMNPATYGKWVIAYDKKQTHFKCCRDILKMIYEKDANAKVLLFMPLIDLCTECAYFLTKNLNYDESFQYDLTIRTINSKNTKAENEENKHSDVIVTTVASCGTGTDIPGITDIINCSPFVSRVTAKQVFGRIRYCGKECHFYDVYDASVRMDGYWIKSRSKVFKSLATKTNYITWEDDEKDDTE